MIFLNFVEIFMELLMNKFLTKLIKEMFQINLNIKVEKMKQYMLFQKKMLLIFFMKFPFLIM